MPVIRFDIQRDYVDVSAAASGLSVRVRNRIVVEADRRGRRRVVGIGADDETADAGISGRVAETMAFDPASFDSELADAFIRYWDWKRRRSGSAAQRLRSAVFPVSIELTWSAWGELPAPARRAFLRSVTAPRAFVSINGREAARRNWLQTLFWLEPTIREWAIAA